MFSKYRLVLAVALCALVQTSMQANNLLVLPAFQSTTTGDGIVFDGLTLQRLSTFTADTAAFAVLTRPTLQPDDARYFVISSSGSNSITTLDKDFKVVGSPLSLGQNVRGAAVSPDGRRLVTTYGQTNLKIFNAADTSEIQTQFIDVGLDPSDVVFTVDSKRIFVLSVAAQRVTAVDLDPSPRVVGSIQLAGTTSTTPGSLTIGPNGLIYVSVESRVLEIDPRGSEINGTNIRRQFNFSNGAKVGKLSFTPDGTRAVAVNLNAAASGDIFYFFHLDLLNGGNASSVVKNTDVLTGLLFDKVFTVSNTRAYAITSKLSTKQRGLYELTLPASGNIAPFEAPTVKEAFFGSLGAVAVTDSLALSNEYPNAFRMYVNAPLNLAQPLAQNTVYSVDLSGQNPTVVGTLPFTFLPGLVGWATPASTIERGDKVGGRDPVNFRQPNPAANGQTLPFGLRVISNTGRPMFNVPVIFTALTAGATIEGLQTVNTNADGIAMVVAKAPATQGEFTIQASVGGSNLTQNFTFTAGNPSTGGGNGGSGGGTSSAGITILYGNGQVIKEGNFSRPVTVKITDAVGKPIGGAQVQWAVTQGRARWRNGTISADAPDKFNTIADANGISTNILVGDVNVGFGTAFLEGQGTVTSGLSTAAIYYTTLASQIDGFPTPYPTVNFVTPNFTVTDRPTIRGRAGEIIQGAIQLRVQNAALTQGGQVMRSVGLETFTYLPGTNANCEPDSEDAACSKDDRPLNPSLASCSPAPIPITDDKGLINCDLRLTGAAGTSVLKVLIGGYSARLLTLVIEPGDPAALKVINGDKQSGEPNALLPGQLRVQVVDGAGNPLAGVPIRWTSLDTSRATLASSTTVSDLNGQAFATVRLGQNPGSATIQATAFSSAALPTATFEVTVNVRAGSLNKVSGDTQNTFTGSSFGQPLIVQVLDTRGQALANQTVEWAVLDGSATIAAATSVSDATGRASMTVRAGAQPGAIRVRAQLPSVTGAQQIFTLSSQLPGPQINALDFYNQASNERGAIVPGSVYTIVGTGIATDIRGCQTGTSLIGTLPTRLAGVEVQFGSTLAPIFNVCNQNGKESVSIQVPFELAPGGAVAVTVRVNAGSSVINGVQVTDLQPGTFETEDGQGRRYAVALRPNGSYVTPENPARWGEIIRFYATGLGQVQPNAFTGSTGVPGQNVIAPVTVGLNDAGARFISAAYAVGQVGVYEIQMEIPQGTATGPARPLGLLMTRSNGQTVTPGNAPTIAVAAQ